LVAVVLITWPLKEHPYIGSSAKSDWSSAKHCRCLQLQSGKKVQQTIGRQRSGMYRRLAAAGCGGNQHFGGKIVGAIDHLPGAFIA